MFKIPLVKVVLLGGSGVGKTSIIDWYTSEEFNPDNPTKEVAIGLKVKKFPEYGVSIKFLLLDTTGQWKYSAGLSYSPYKHADAVILVYSIANKNTTYFRITK